MFLQTQSGPRALPADAATTGAIAATPRRRGVTSVLAMLYLVIFAALALGFYAQTNISAQVASGELRGIEAQNATESGLQFIRYHLSAINTAPGLTPAKAFEDLYMQLADTMEGTPNLGTKVVGYTAATASAPACIQIPSSVDDYIQLAPKGPRFRVKITDANPKLDVKVVGTSGASGVRRAIKYQFQRAPKPYSLVGINSLTMSGAAFSDSYDASKGAYDPTKARAGGSVASNGNLTLSNTAKVNGDVRYGLGSTLTVDPTATITGMAAPITSAPAYPSVTLPPAGTYTDLGDMTMSSGTTTVAGGTYVINKLTLSGTAKIVWSGPVKLYIKTSYSVTGNVVIQTYNNLPINRQLYFLPTCTTATWGGTNVSVGELYAPDTAFTIKDSVEMMGRVIAKSITNSSSGGMHYDESLPSAYGMVSYAPVASSYLEVQP